MIRLYWIAIVAVIVLAWGVTAALYPGLPARIPTHWNIHDKIDGYGPKGTLFLVPATMIGLFLMVGLLPALSPRSFEVDSSRETYLYIMLLVMAQMGYIQAVLLYTVATGRSVAMSRVLFAGLFLVLALLGNVMGRVRRNFYIGVRVPWTLASERVWNDTHRVAAWLMVACGLGAFLITVTGLPLLAALGVIAIAVVVPIVYAFVHYKRLERRGAL